MIFPENDYCECTETTQTSLLRNLRYFFACRWPEILLVWRSLLDWISMHTEFKCKVSRRMWRKITAERHAGSHFFWNLDRSATTHLPGAYFLDLGRSVGRLECLSIFLIIDIHFTGGSSAGTLGKSNLFAGKECNPSDRLLTCELFQICIWRTSSFRHSKLGERHSSSRCASEKDSSRWASVKSLLPKSPVYLARSEAYWWALERIRWAIHRINNL